MFPKPDRHHSRFTSWTHPMRCDSIINEKGWLPVKTRQSKKLKLAGILVLFLALLVSVGSNLYLAQTGFSALPEHLEHPRSVPVAGTGLEAFLLIEGHSLLGTDEFQTDSPAVGNMAPDVLFQCSN